MTLPQKLSEMQAGGSVKAIVPQDFDGAWRIAKVVVQAGMAPQGLDKPERAMVAIMHGLEVGFTPMAALQSIAVINNRATIWGDGALALVQASGLMESRKEWLEGEGSNRVAHCVVKRKGDPEPKKGKFSVADAKEAKLWMKKGRSGQDTPWVTYPERMLKMRARAFALRDGFADVLKGLGIAEEVQDTPMRDITPPEPPAPPSEDEAPQPPESEITEAEIVQDTPPETEPEKEAQVIDGEIIDNNAFFEELEGALGGAMDMETLEEVWTEYDPLARFDGDDVNIGIVNAIKNRRVKQIEKANEQAG